MKKIKNKNASMWRMIYACGIIYGARIPDSPEFNIGTLLLISIIAVMLVFGSDGGWK